MEEYFSMLKTEIRQFVSTQHYGTLFELQDAARRLAIEIEIQRREERKAPVQPQPTTKRFKPAIS